MSDPFANLPRGHFGAIYADPPWRFQAWSGKGTARSADQHYDTMTIADMAALPVADLCAENCVLFMWVSWPLLRDALGLIDAWGFTYKTCGFDWIKAKARQLDMLRDDEPVQVGMGYWTRANSEPCLLATRGKPKRLNADVRQGIIEPRREHSRKPDCVHGRIERLVAGPYLELFARAPRQGWTVWGNQTDKFPEGSMTPSLTPYERDAKYRVLSLFAGIGGFDLGLERTGGFETVAFCEIDPFCRRVLAKHWPEVPCYHDVRELTAERLAADGIAVDVICGGFPCQDVSSAGLRAGIGGERSSLWGEIARLTGELRPCLILVENVTGLLEGGKGAWFGKVLGDLAALGYDAEWHCIPASYAGALHQRDRVWIAAYPHANSLRFQGIRPPSERPWAEEKFAGLVQVALRNGVPSGKSSGISDGVPDRAHRLRALGNAVVPQIPELIGRAILESERQAA